MANWCDCELTVKGKLVDLAAFSMKVSSSKPESSPKKEVLDRMTGKPEERVAYLDATKIAPKNPDDKYKLPRDWNSQSGLPTNWILTNWGSTRPFCDVERKVRTRSIWFRFDSASKKWENASPSWSLRSGTMRPVTGFPAKFISRTGKQPRNITIIIEVDEVANGE